MWKGIDSQVYEVLAAAYPKATTQVNHDEVGAYRTKAVRAGDFLYLQCYPLITVPANKRQKRTLEQLRDEKRLKMLVRINRYNNRKRALEFEQLVQENFGKGDLHIALTYATQDWSMEREPEYYTREEAKAHLSYFIVKLKRLAVKHGIDPKTIKYIRVTVTKEGNHEGIGDRPDTHHHHMLLSGFPEELRTEIERLWDYGYCNADRLQPNDKGIAEVANYIARQEGSANGAHTKKYDRSWTGSRNLKKPKVTTSDTRLSRRRVGQIAEDVRLSGKAIFEKIYPDYRVVEWPEVTVSEFTAGAYIRVKLRRKYPKGAKGENDGTGVFGGGQPSDAAHRGECGTDRAASGAGGAHHADLRSAIGRLEGISGQSGGNGRSDRGFGKRTGCGHGTPESGVDGG